MCVLRACVPSRAAGYAQWVVVVMSAPPPPPPHGRFATLVEGAPHIEPALVVLGRKACALLEGQDGAFVVTQLHPYKEG